MLLYRDKDLRKHQYFTYPDWPGGLYLSPGLAGSRSGGIIASTWAAILATGRVGLPRRGRRHHAHGRGHHATGIRARHPRARGHRRPDVPRGVQGVDERPRHLPRQRRAQGAGLADELAAAAAGAALLHHAAQHRSPASAEAFLDALRGAVAYAAEHAGRAGASPARCTASAARRRATPRSRP